MKDLLWAPINLLQTVAFGLWTACWISLALGLALVSRSPRPGLVLARRVWAPGVLAVAGARLEVSGRDRVPAGGSLIASNHQSLLDIPALFAALPVSLRFVAKQELRAVPFLGWYMRAMGMVFVDRHRRASGAAGTHRVGELLARGASVLSFPAGTRDSIGQMQRFKAAGFAAPIAAGVPVLPVAVDGAGRVLAPGGIRLRPGVIRVAIGEPIATTGMATEARAELARRVEEEVRRLHAGLAERAEAAATRR